ncbi:glycerophosphodiester phosphodiesterase family protein [Roseisalinus antarcticus]|uniref:Glycerophosphoryl diester phosphodiesterase n=1 Tax=Roseisalinus antarcticus TaxID=254357 RepID=A0A1Y5TXK4_9RHOB|nr:glycerophosphodiester phosphodiesterase family protein [Roseisalinus antarcticus]SLN75092.1 Glycerophosphoryl diester phosphodiesterase [Roseisalinus antarcticus]
MNDWTLPPRPLSIAHRGAQAYAPGNTLSASEKAHTLGADMWEVDIRCSRDGIVIAHHDAELADGTAVRDMDYADILSRTRAACAPCPTLDDVAALAAQSGTGIYADIKDLDAVLPALAILRRHGIDRAILGAFAPEAAAMLKQAECPYPRSALVPLQADPFVHAAGAGVIHLCWERLERPQDTLTPDFFRRAFDAGQRVVLWHEEDPARMAAIRGKPVLGICSDRPEMVNPFTPPDGRPLRIVCHRGANGIAPENTLPALECALAAGFAMAETDLRVTACGTIVAIHDATLDRTTDGTGRVDAHSLTELRLHDAGGWFDPFFNNVRIPTLDEVLALAVKYDGGLYLELKDAAPGQVWAAVQAAGLEQRCFFWSFDMDLLRALRQDSAAARIMVRREDHPSLDVALATLAPAIIEFRPDADAAEVAALRDGPVASMIAYMGRDGDVFDRIVDMRPDMVNLDQPFAFVRHLDGKTFQPMACER